MDPLPPKTDDYLRLKNPPIVEAILDIDCDMPSGQSVTSIEAGAREAFGDRYSIFRIQHLEEHKIEISPSEGRPASVRRNVQALQFSQPDGLQLVQIRVQGYAFNRLAPYSSFDDYLPEIRRTWNLFIKLAMPTLVRALRLRYINRILIPLDQGQVQLDNYFTVAPQLPDGSTMTFAGFLNQHLAVENATNHRVNTVLTSQAPESNRLPVIFDNCAAAAVATEPNDWPYIEGKIQSLRALQNRIFRKTLTQQCLNLFQ